MFFNNISLNPSNFVQGEVIKNDAIVTLLKQVSLSLRESSYIPTTSKRNIVSIDIIPVDNGVEIYFQTRNGMRIVLKDGLKFTTDKLLRGLERYNYFHQEGVISGDIEVFHNELDNEIYIRYEKVQSSN